MKRSSTFLVLVMLFSKPVAAADEYQWVYSQSDELIELGYVIPDSDAIDTIISCQPGGKSINYVDVETSAKLGDKKKATVILRVGGKPFTLKGKLTPNEEAGVPSFEAERPVKDKLWAAMAKAKDYETEMAGETESHSLKGADMARLLKACGG